MAYQNLNYSTSAINNLLQKCDNASGGDVSGYITNSTMSSTYLTKTNASNNYQVKGTYVTTSQYNSLCWNSEVSTYNTQFNDLYNTTDLTLLNHYCPVGTVIITRSSSYSPNNMDVLKAGNWSNTSGVLYGRIDSSTTHGSSTWTLECDECPQPNHTVTTASANQDYGPDGSTWHVHATPVSGYGYTTTDENIGELGIAGAIPGTVSYWFPRMGSKVDIAYHSNTAVQTVSHTHSDSATNSRGNLNIQEEYIPVTCWRRTG